MKWHFDILPQEQQKVWASLRPCKDFGCIPDGMVDLASLEDLLALKLTAILETGEVPLHAGLSGAMGLYGDEFSPTYSLKAMTYFKEKSLAALDANV